MIRRPQMNFPTEGRPATMTRREPDMTHTVEKIGGTCMSRATELLDSALIGCGTKDSSMAASSWSRPWRHHQPLLEHKKSGQSGVYALFADADNDEGWSEALTATGAEMCAPTPRSWTTTATASAPMPSCATGSKGRAPA
jgi:hypothetical protein